MYQMQQLQNQIQSFRHSLDQMSQLINQMHQQFNSLNSLAQQLSQPSISYGQQTAYGMPSFTAGMPSFAAPGLGASPAQHYSTPALGSYGGGQTFAGSSAISPTTAAMSSIGGYTRPAFTAPATHMGSSY